MDQSPQIHPSKFDASRLDIAKTLAEIQHVKKQIDLVRYEINSFLALLANVSDSSNPQHFFHSVAAKVFQLREQLADYLVHYNNLLPVIQLLQQASGFSAQKFDVVNLPPFVNDKPASSGGSAASANMNNVSKNQQSQQGKNRPKGNATTFKSPSMANSKVTKPGNGSNNKQNLNVNAKNMMMSGTTPSHSIVL